VGGTNVETEVLIQFRVVTNLVNYLGTFEVRADVANEYPGRGDGSGDGEEGENGGELQMHFK